VRHRELRVDGNGTLEMGDRGGETTGEQGVPGGAIRLQSFQRGRGCLLQGRRMLLNAGQRLAQPGPDLNRNSGERVQDLFFPSRLRLLLTKNVSGAAVPGA